jgi:predicted O-methyltransferase YrrM
VSTDLKLPSRIWGTKGFEFWTFLSLLMLQAGSRRILELGSGRSTITFAEYAHSRSARLISLETSEEWYNKAQLELRCLDLPTDAVRLIELDESTGWYELGQFHSHAYEAFPYDCIFIDAPNDPEGRSAGMRDSPLALRELGSLCRNTDLILIDDVQRRHIFDTIEQTISDASAYDTYFFDYRVLATHLNSLSLSARRGSPAARAIPRIQGTLGLTLDTRRSAERCPET